MRPLLLAVTLLAGCKTVVVNCPAAPAQYGFLTPNHKDLTMPLDLPLGFMNADCKHNECRAMGAQ